MSRLGRRDDDDDDDDDSRARVARSFDDAQTSCARVHIYIGIASRCGVGFGVSWTGIAGASIRGCDDADDEHVDVVDAWWIVRVAAVADDDDE